MPPERRFCRLCITLCHKYKDLYDENGQGNDIYEITLKYFDPMLLSPDHEQDSKVVCLECWNNISTFYSFQKTVLQAHEDLEISLQEVVKQAVAEDELNLRRGTGIEVIYAAVDPRFEEDVPVPDGDTTMDNITFTSEDDDEMPLNLRFRKAGRKEKSNKKKYVKEKASIIHEVERTHIYEDKSKQRNKVQKSERQGKTKSAIKVKCNVLKREEQSQDADIYSNNEIEDDNGDTSNNDKDAIIAQWKPELECIICSASTLNFSLLRAHFRTEHPNEKCYIICCERKFSKRCDIFEHIQLHIDPDVFKCNICGKNSTNSRNLAKHIRDLHTEEGKERPYECEVCQKRFQNKTKLRTHMDVHESARNHVCKECGKGFCTEQRRKIHERMVHNVDRVCDQCGKTIHGIYALKQHLKEHAGVQKPKWPCDQCDVQLNSHSSLKRHKQLRHHDGSTTYICSECGKMFPSQSALHSHKRLVHIMERKYKCDICGKAFKFPKNLREHMASHTGIDLYQCPYCPKTFKVSANLHHHRKREHPKEWAEARTNKHVSDNLNLSLIKHEIVI